MFHEADKVNDKTYFGMPARVDGTLIVLRNNADGSYIFFNDSVDYVYGEMLGDNDMLIHRTLGWEDSLIYLKKRLPYQY